MGIEIVGVILLLAIPVAGLAGFFMALRLRSRAAIIEARLAKVEARLVGLAAGEAGIAAALAPAPQRPPAAEVERPAAEAVPASPPLPAEAAIAASPAMPAAAPAPEPGGQELPLAAPPMPPMPPVPAAARPAGPGLEERLGSRWAVWVGGVALALGGLLMVRYSIEQGYFGPGARIALATLLALALIGGGEWFRRRERTQDLAGIPSAHIPGVLTAAGTASAFATAYAAYALYGFIGPATAFVLLGAIAVATMFAAALHGPALAGLGLVGALANPLLVSTNDPRPWPLVLYLAFVVTAAYGLARLRIWRWLALAAAVGALAWGFLIVVAIGGGAMLPGLVHVVVETLLAAFFLVVEPHRGIPDEAVKPDWFAGAILAAFALLAVLASDLPPDGGSRALFAGAVVALHLGLGLGFAATSVASVLAAAVAAATLWLWPVAHYAAADQPAVLPGAGGSVPLPEALSLYLAFAVLAGSVLIAGPLLRLARGRALSLLAAAPYAIAATAGPIALLTVAYWRVTQFERSLSFALAAGLLGTVFSLAAGWLRRREADTAVTGEATARFDPLRLGLGAAASAAIGALALGLTFALDKGMLTVAFALAALGTSVIATRVGIPALRYAVGALGCLVLGRLAWDPTIAGDDLGTTPIFNWLLWGYGVPAVSFVLAAQVLARVGRDRVTQLCESLAIVFSALLVFFEIRHALNGGDPFAADVGHLEAGLFATAGLAFSIVLVRLDGRRPDPVYRVATLVFGGLTLLAAGLGLAAGANPLITGDEVEGGAIFNSLIIAYLLPAVLAGLLAALAQATRPRWYVLAAAGLALVLQFLYTIMEVRRLFQGPVIDLDRSTGDAELWTYSVVLVVIGVALLAVGLIRDLRLARLLSAAYIVAAVVKVFLIDLSNLEGVLRALSFIGLGLVLVGIGLAYQKLLGRRRPAFTDTSIDD